ncbi:kinase-like protein [Laetiporus sulphureus 93-53]|uniref:Kinase-like protein n=1 Tax=Laetiporus sulphureus 93-53 TaxID=1314785 RepID=A0A165FHM6_9APHY|nr:kinase-like protein [Laetiporus sulphureus 93-53]KZT08985.1 kinase-like protein [Laetiporus sulphureus 93-53]
MEHQVPFVVKLRWSFQDEKALYIVLIDRCEENLRMRLERSGVLHPGNAKMCAAEMVYALTALHAIGIVHRDLKPESVLIQPDGHIALTDFGYAQINPIGKQDVAVDKDAPSAAPTKGIYRAPEVIMGWAHDAAVDWWGFGLILCFMLTGSHPFLAVDDSASLHETISESKVLHGKLMPCLPEMVSSEALDLITQCLERNPALRLSDEAVKQHSFFATVYVICP